jgi:hypothetical protein
MSRTAQTVGCDFYAIGADKLRVGTSNSLALEFVFAILGSHSLSCSILESPDPLQVGTFFFATSECDFCAIGARKVGAACCSNWRRSWISIRWQSSPSAGVWGNLKSRSQVGTFFLLISTLRNPSVTFAANRKRLRTGCAIPDKLCKFKGQLPVCPDRPCFAATVAAPQPGVAKAGS